MRRTEQVQGLRLMKFEEVYGRSHRGGLSQAEAAEVLGVSERTFRRWRDRYEAEGADGLYDRRLGRVSARRAPVDEVARVLELFDTRYWDFTAKHFHEKLVADHGFKRSYNWLRLSLQAHGRGRAAPRSVRRRSFDVGRLARGRRRGGILARVWTSGPSVDIWPECGHLARPTLGWKSQTGRPERKRFAFHTRSMGTARPGASALAGQHLPQHVATVPIRLMFSCSNSDLI